MSRRSTTSSWRRPGARSRARATRRRTRRSLGRCRRRPLEPPRRRGPPRAPLGHAAPAPAGEHRVLVRLSAAVARRERGWAQRRHEDPALPERHVPHVRAGGAVRAGRAVRVEHRRDRLRAGHRERLPVAARSDADHAHRAARRSARGCDRTGDGAGGRLPRRGRGGGRRLRRGRRRRSCPVRPLGADHARVRRARRVRSHTDRLWRGRAGAVPALLRRALPLVDGAAAQPDRDRLVPHHRHVQPCLLPARGDPQPPDHGLGRRGARTGLRLPRGGRRGRAHRVGAGAPDEGVADRSRASTRSVALAVAARTIHNVFTNPALLLPSVVFPLFFFTAFAGGLSRVSSIPGFHFAPGYTAFQFVFVLIQSSAFGGVFTGFGVARDFEMGFGRRLLLAAPNRRAIIAGYAIAAVVRATFTMVVITGVALIAGMNVGGSGVDLFGLYGLAFLLNLGAALWAVGVALRVRTIQGGPMMQVPIFLTLFLAPVYVPLDFLPGWIHAVATVNPFTALLGAGRDLISGEASGVGLAFAVVAGLIAVFVLWSWRGLR